LKYYVNNHFINLARISHNVLVKRRFDSPKKQNRQVLQGWQTVAEKNRTKGVLALKRTPDCGLS